MRFFCVGCIQLFGIYPVAHVQGTTNRPFIVSAVTQVVISDGLYNDVASFIGNNLNLGALNVASGYVIRT